MHGALPASPTQVREVPALQNVMARMDAHIAGHHFCRDTEGPRDDLPPIVQIPFAPRAREGVQAHHHRQRRRARERRLAPPPVHGRSSPARRSPRQLCTQAVLRRGRVGGVEGRALPDLEHHQVGRHAERGVAPTAGQELPARRPAFGMSPHLGRGVAHVDAPQVVLAPQHALLDGPVEGPVLLDVDVIPAPRPAHRLPVVPGQGELGALQAPVLLLRQAEVVLLTQHRVVTSVRRDRGPALRQLRAHLGVREAVATRRSVTGRGQPAPRKAEVHARVRQQQGRGEQLHQDVRPRLQRPRLREPAPMDPLVGGP